MERMEEQMLRRRLVALVLLPLLLLLSGCPKDPYTASLKGSADVSQAVSSAIKIAAQYYSTGKLNDAKKAEVASVLNTITDCNMSFRKAVVNTHNAGLTGVESFLPVANSFVSCAQISPQLANDPSAQSILKAVTTAINGVSLAVASAKGK
jgi:hypothetical protein